MVEKIPPVHPGEVLLEDYLIPMGVSQHQLALSMRVPPNRINAIIQGKRAITAETALRLARAIGTSPDFWLNLQVAYDLRLAKEHLGDAVAKEVIPIVG
ncbi:MAG: HigA family addiction module antidote protein [Anaerolineales bacterium]|nr:HigA family addiction module antidote protein [Anaerolineales bacterium]